MSTDNKRDDKILSLIIGGISIIIFLLLAIAFALSSEKSLFETKNDYYVIAYFKEIGMLEAGASVKYGGVHIGHVTDVSLLSDQNIKIEARIFTNKKIPDNSKLAITATAVSGDTFLNLILGGSSNYISHSNSSLAAPELKGIDFICLQNIGCIFSEAQEKAIKLFNNIEKLIGKNSYLQQKIKEIQKKIPAITSKYIAFEDKKIFFMNKIKVLQDKIKEIQQQTQKTTTECSEIITSKITTTDISKISKSIKEISSIIDIAINSKETATIKNNYTKINNWAKSLKIEEDSVLGVFLCDKKYSPSKTVEKVTDAIDKVQDFSIFKKLGFYFKGKKLLSNFEERTNSKYLTASRYMYNWSLFSYKRNLYNCDLPAGKKKCPANLK